jgi:hypothetical protein
MVIIEGEMGDGRWEMGDGRWEIGDGRSEMGDRRSETGVPIAIGRENGEALKSHRSKVLQSRVGVAILQEANIF